MSGLGDVAAAAGSLGDRRRPILISCIRARNGFAAAGEHELAAWFHALAVVLVEYEEHEADVLTSLDFSPGVEIIGIELPGSVDEPGYDHDE